jgi:hypothetical protein
MLGPPLGRAVLVCPGVPRPAYVGPQKALRGCSEEWNLKELKRQSISSLTAGYKILGRSLNTADLRAEEGRSRTHFLLAMLYAISNRQFFLYE